MVRGERARLGILADNLLRLAEQLLLDLRVVELARVVEDDLELCPYPARGSRSARLPHPARCTRAADPACRTPRSPSGRRFSRPASASRRSTAAAQGSTAPPGCPASPPDASDSARRSRRPPSPRARRTSSAPCSPRGFSHKPLPRPQRSSCCRLRAETGTAPGNCTFKRSSRCRAAWGTRFSRGRARPRAARHHLAAFLADDCVIRAGIQVSKLSVLFHNHSLRPFRILSCVLFNFFKLGSQFIKQNTFQHLSSTNREVSQSLLLFPRFLLDCLYRINESFQEEPPIYRPLLPQL